MKFFTTVQIIKIVYGSNTANMQRTSYKSVGLALQNKPIKRLIDKCPVNFETKG